ncbi:MAG: hypothetical protein R6V73_12995 [Anaerolineales bacterium]|jgi:hypothetical protein
MSRGLKTILWLPPFIGLGLGYLFAYLSFHGFLETWPRIDKPDEDIVRIIGIRDDRRLLVATTAGQLYSFEFAGHDWGAPPNQISWIREQDETIDRISSIQYFGADFFTLPPLFRVEQLFELEYIYRFEGKGEIKFALAPDGNIWMWRHQIAGLTGLIKLFYPFYGFLAGLAAILMIYIGHKFIR